MDNATVWKIIDKYFEQNQQSLVRHHIESYNDFFKNGIFQIFKEKNPIQISTRFDEKLDDHRSKCIMYFGGKNGDKIYFGKPVIYDEANTHYMFPNEARLRDMTYGMTIHYDIDIDFIDILEDGEQPTIIGEEDLDISEETEEIEGGAKTAAKRKGKSKKKNLDLTPAEFSELKELTKKSMVNENTQKRSITLEKILLGKFPIMLQSDYCVLSGAPRDVVYNMGECESDYGGYFIIDGKEKTVVSQEKFADNMLYIREMNDDNYLYSAEIRSVSENVSKPIRTLSVRVKAPSSKFTFENIVVNIPNVRSPVPLFIVFRALGFLSDKEIISMCLLDLDKYEQMVDLFIPSVHDAGGIMTQRNALKYIALLTKGKTTSHALEILCDYFLPHIGEKNFKQKAYYLGNIVFRLLCNFKKMEEPTDRDNFKYKRIELVGSLIYDLFREYYTIQQRTIQLEFEKIAHYNQALYANNLFGLINQKYKEIFRDRIVEAGFKRAFKGDWGSQSHTKRIGVIQDLNRLSHNSMMSHLRKTNLPLDATAKVVGPRVLHNTQWGYFDPIDTPDGGNIGLHKHLAISTYISQGYSREKIILWLREKANMKLIEDCTPLYLSTLTKVFVNGAWSGAVDKPIEIVDKFKLFRRNALIPIYTSISFDTALNTIFIYTDAGRVCRPLFYFDKETNKMSNLKPTILKKIESNEFTWNELISGFNNKKMKNYHPNNYEMFELHELYENIDSETNPAKLKRFLEDSAIIDYVDTSESDTALIALDQDALNSNTKKFTHLEIHQSFIFGMLCNMINFPQNNPATRNSFSCGQTKQASSLYHTNHQVRMDKTSVVLNNGQNPLVRSRYMDYINHGKNPYGENTIVAVMCYTGYNVEDAILVNEGSLKRGLFRTTYYSTYTAHEEQAKTGSSEQQISFVNVESDSTIVGQKPGYDYSKLDKYGIVKANTELNDKTILIGSASYDTTDPTKKLDASKTTKKGQLGIVDKTFITDGEEGVRLAKVRVREERIPNIGDKMASRAGQKGTIGLVIPEADMPFSKNGTRPDLIINPHAIPSRMTIGQFVETITGKACAAYGAIGDCTAYNQDGSKVGVFGEMLTKVGYHSSGNEILYNGMTGEQIETEIFMGPNYYMRLKHMVKDKINYRAQGPRTALTKQAVSGRANDGGLRIGEMERDTIIAHGATDFLRESMMERGDDYQMAVCNTSGMIAIYNPAKNVFLSPMADGPIKYVGSIDEKSLHIDNVSRFGRNFSIVRIPYSMKLLMQELLAVNISMRIITEDNIEQLENMSFSNNIDLLLQQKNVDPKEIVQKIRNTLNRSKMQPNIMATPLSISEDSPAYNPLSPGDSESYHPITPEESPGYNPISPEDSPPYNPISPDNNDKNKFVPMTPPGTPPNENTTPVSLQSDPFSVSTDGSIPPPPTSTPPDNIAYGGAKEFKENNEVFKENDLVFYRGDSKPKRIWKVHKLGNSFITIKTEDMESLDAIDTTKIVSQADIYPMQDFPYSTPFSENIPTNEESNKIKMNNPEQPAININIAPVINNQSTDNSQESGLSNNDDNMVMPGINIKSQPDNGSKPNNLSNNNNEPNLFSGGIIVKKT